MTNPSATTLTRFAAIGAYIREHADPLVEQWEELSREEQSEASGEQRTTLRNQLPDFLRDYGRNLDSGNTAVPRKHAIEHGIQRWTLGWNVESLTRDFMILRRVLISELRRAIDLSIEEAIAISATLDEAVTTSISAYVDYREAELKMANEQLRRSNYELKRFAQVIAHEIRGPLTAISMAADRLQRACDGNTDPEVTNAADTIAEGTATIRDVIGDLLSYAQIETANGEQEEQVDLNAVMQETLTALRYQIEESEADVSADQLPTLRGHHAAMYQLFHNMIENGIKYSGEQRPRIHVGARRDEAGWVLSFRDHGLGIPEEDQESVFRFLFRAHPDLNVPGTGIGLAICNRIVQQSGGRLWVHSVVGEGSTFFASLPV